MLRHGIIKKLFLVLSVIIIISPLKKLEANPWYQGDPWSNQDIYLQLTYLTFVSIDWLQTRKIASDPNRKEMNPFLGPNPSLRKVDLIIGSSIIAHSIITWILPTKYRPFWQMLWIGAEMAATSHNYSVGIRIKI